MEFFTKTDVIVTKMDFDFSQFYFSMYIQFLYKTNNLIFISPNQKSGKQP